MNDKDIELDNEQINIVLDENVIDQIPEIDNISITENSVTEIKNKQNNDDL